MEFPCPALMILSIELPRALLRIKLEQSDVNNSAIGVDIPRTARALYAIAPGHREHVWHHVAVSLSRPQCTLDTFPVEIIRMGEPAQSYLFDNCCFHGVNPPLDHEDFGLNHSKIMKVIDTKSLERDAGGKPVSTFPHPALARTKAESHLMNLGAEPKIRYSRSLPEIWFPRPR